MNIVLIEPEIHWNTGNIGRTCIATGSTLHLVKPLGFSLDDKAIRRSGLDYWPKLRLVVHEGLEQFLAALPKDAALKLFSVDGKRSFWDAQFGKDDYLLFGKESVGLPAALREAHRTHLYRVPVTKDVRSLNLSTVAGVVLFEALRQTSSLT